MTPIENLTVNDSSLESYQPGEAGHVTALFEPEADLRDRLSRAVDVLAEVFPETDIEIYIGSHGAKALDVHHEKASRIERFLRKVERAFGDERQRLHRAHDVMNDGGALIVVNAGNDEQLKNRAADLLETCGAVEVTHWNDWTTEWAEIR